MALDRWIALVFLLLCLVYGYSAFFVMDAGLPPFMQRNPIWPSTFPKVLAACGVLVSLVVLLGFEKGAGEPKQGEIDYRRLAQYDVGRAIALLLLMAGYAFTLRPLGFIASTILFLVLAAAILGERRMIVLVPIAVIAAVGVWYLVQEVLGIYLRPLPTFL